MQRHNKESSAPPMKGKVGLVYYSQSQTTEKQNSRWVGVGRVAIEPSPRHHDVTTTASLIVVAVFGVSTSYAIFGPSVSIFGPLVFGVWLRWSRSKVVGGPSVVLLVHCSLGWLVGSFRWWVGVGLHSSTMLPLALQHRLA